jgi:hypothetical protein
VRSGDIPEHWRTARPSRLTRLLGELERELLALWESGKLWAAVSNATMKTSPSSSA